MPSREQLQTMLEADPTDEFLQYSVAMACASEGNEEEAAERLKALCDANPDHVSAWFQRGQILNRLDETDEAREVLLTGVVAAQRVGDSHAEAEMRAFLDML
jgi:Flp pilus assembly protein TadD